MREQFMITMYGKMWDNINRHILIVWQSVSVLGGAIAALALEQNKILSIDVSTTLIVALGTWQVANVLDAAWWFNRNLIIVTNIERQFLNNQDIREVHYYFSRHRKPRMLDHYKIQLWFGVVVTGFVVLYHFFSRILSGIFSPRAISYVDLIRCVPYIVLVACLLVLRQLYIHQQAEYKNLREQSPGREVGGDSKPVRSK